jgi:uncharacterized repeat protein (TIGR03803 family)
MSKIRLLVGAALTIAATLPALAAKAPTLATIHCFIGVPDGSFPEAALLSQGGILYGVTADGGDDRGTVFQLDPTTNTETILHNFTGKHDGWKPETELTYGDGMLYGTTTTGGRAFPNGTVFQVNPTNGAETVLYGFTDYAGGDWPNGLTFHNGILYGTTFDGGTGCAATLQGCGTVFSVDPATGTKTTLYNFSVETDGRYPRGGLLYHAGLLYGVTTDGGYGYGTVFAINPKTKVETIIYHFLGRPDAVGPTGGLIYRDGILYGTSGGGGANNMGAVFAIDLATKTETVLYSFTGADGLDGVNSQAKLVYRGGYLYGTTTDGGTANDGIVFKVNATTGAETILYRFKGGPDGYRPPSGLTYLDGAFYGTTTASRNDCKAVSRGTIYKLTP